MQAPHVQDTLHAEVPTHVGHLHDDPWKAPLLPSVDEQSPQPQPCGCACMRTEQAPQRHPAQWDSPERAAEDVQEGHVQDLPWAPLGEHEEQEHPVPCEAAALRLCCRPIEEVEEDKREVGNAPGVITPAGMKKASASLATSASVAAPIRSVGFMVLKLPSLLTIDCPSRR